MGRLVRQARQAAGLRPADLLPMATSATQMVSVWERGARPIPADTAMHLARELGLPALPHAGLLLRALTAAARVRSELPAARLWRLGRLLRGWSVDEAARCGGVTAESWRRQELGARPSDPGACELMGFPPDLTVQWWGNPPDGLADGLADAPDAIVAVAVRTLDALVEQRLRRAPGLLEALGPALVRHGLGTAGLVTPTPPLRPSLPRRHPAPPARGNRCRV